MIDPKELRLGIWLIDSLGENVKCTPGLLSVVLGQGGYSAFDGIPITAKILQKCGFVKDYTGYHLPKTQLSISITKDGKYLACWYDKVLWPGAIKNLEYLHQLQNLYFALTGEELEVKL